MKSARIALRCPSIRDHGLKPLRMTFDVTATDAEETSAQDDSCHRAEFAHDGGVPQVMQVHLWKVGAGGTAPMFTTTLLHRARQKTNLMGLP